jgi:hypothetical protein
VAAWRGGGVTLERLESEVPTHHASTGHVRHDPMMRHGGGGSPQTAEEPHRLEHLARFMDQVAGRLPAHGAIAIIGPGTVREHLESVVRTADERRRATRPLTCEASTRLTERQLVARLRRLAGDEPRRRTVGAYRWTGEQPHKVSGSARPPRRVSQKPSPKIDEVEGPAEE